MTKKKEDSSNSYSKDSLERTKVKISDLAEELNVTPENFTK